jgi:CheY-like chemotaxis protein
MFFSRAKSDKKRILVVEDDPAQRALVIHTLEGEGYELLEASDGAEGVEKALKELPDLIVMDVMMPRMSGFDAVRSIRKEEKAKAIPILMCTAKDTMADVERSMALGANDYITKPLDLPRFRKKVKRLIDPTATPAP